MFASLIQSGSALQVLGEVLEMLLGAKGPSVAIEAFAGGM